MKSIVGFERHELARHFQKHRREFRGATDMVAYERLAVAFVTSDRSGIEECQRSNNDSLYFDPMTGEFAVCTENGLIRTYFMADRAHFERACDE